MNASHSDRIQTVQAGPSGCLDGLKPGALPCLDSNNSTEGQKFSSLHEFTSAYARTAYALQENVEYFAHKFGLEHVGFLTLTFADDVRDHKEAGRRFNSFNTHFLKRKVKSYIGVIERQPHSQRWHYHLLVALYQDIRTGVNFAEFDRGNYRSAGNHLRYWWQELRLALPQYGFGRHELLPIRSNEECIGRYVGKYIRKHITQREEKDKGARLVRYAYNARNHWPTFAWNSEGACEWRRKMETFADIMGFTDWQEIKERLGPRWAWAWRETIMQIDEQHGFAVRGPNNPF